MSETQINGQIIKTPQEIEVSDKSAGQRRVNILWELTQASLAILISSSSIYCAINKIDAKAIDAAFVLVVYMYFQRTNHTKIGGIGGTDSR